MSSIEDLQCKHGHFVDCKQCDDELYATMYQAGIEYRKQREQLILDTILKGATHGTRPSTATKATPATFRTNNETSRSDV